jgi:hypothetical protein
VLADDIEPHFVARCHLLLSIVEDCMGLNIVVFEQLEGWASIVVEHLVKLHCTRSEEVHC